MKTGLATELLQQEGSGVCQLFLTLAILPVTIFIIRKNLVDLREQASEHLQQLDDKDGEAVVENPLDVED